MVSQPVHYGEMKGIEKLWLRHHAEFLPQDWQLESILKLSARKWKIQVYLLFAMFLVSALRRSFTPGLRT